MSECFCFLAVLGVSSLQLSKAEILLLDILPSWLEGTYLETVNQVNNTGIIFSISLHLDSLDLAMELKRDFQLRALHK